MIEIMWLIHTQPIGKSTVWGGFTIKPRKLLLLEAND